MRSLSSIAFASLTTLTLALVLPMTGCKKPVYPECKKDKHCKQDLGEKCVDGKCQNCAANTDCVGKGPNGEDWTCFEFRCVDPNDPILGGGGSGALGSPCTQSLDCGGGLVCTAGKCSNCTDDIQCEGGTCNPDTGTCSTPGGAGGQCSTDDDCAMDEICDNGTCAFSGVTPGKENPCGIDAIYFGFDSPKIDDEAQAQLDQIATCLVEQNTLVYLEAHADPRGTEEYNIMLTDKRGQTVKRFLEDLGVPGEVLQVISKGSLEATGTDEASMKKDRRVELVFQ
jgi:peptidoglycan-associated lipoprotein